MKITLFQKILAATILLLFLIIVVLALIVQRVTRQNFAEYVAKTELGELNEIAKALETRYNRDGSWNGLRDDMRQWHYYIEKHLPEAKGKKQRLRNLALGDPRRDGVHPWPPPRRPSPPFMGPESVDGFPGQAPEEDELRPPPPVIPSRTPLIGPRLTLFDGAKTRVVGHGVSIKKHLLRPLKVNGNTVGWLGILPMDQLVNPLNAAFLRQQARSFCLAAVAVFVVAVIIAYVLSRNILAPIRKMAQATKDLASFRFDTMIDIHSNDELGRLAADFNAMTRKLEKYELMRRQWISDISHELRTPLAILKGEIEALQDGVRQVTPERLCSLHSEVNRMGKLIDDLHLLSKADSENLAQRTDPVPLVPSIRTALRTFVGRLEQAGIQVQADLPQDDAITVMGDEDRLAQLFSNIIENTIRYTDSPGILRVSATVSDEKAAIVFEDSEPGVPESSLGFLFDRLYRVDSSRSRASGGRGLGLSITESIVEAHDGRIKADHSALGGLRVTIELPLAAR